MKLTELKKLFSRAASRSSIPAIGATADKSNDNVFVEASSVFAVDCYRQLVGEKPDENHFFSPYSIMTALMIAGEGARGQTAAEFGTTLRFPKSLKQGDPRLPWDTTELHAAQSALFRQLNPDANSSEQVKLQEEAEQLETTLDSLQAEMTKARQAREWKTAEQLRDKEEELIEQLDTTRNRIDTMTLRTANALWREQSFPVHDDWQQLVQATYGADVIQTADFKNQPGIECERINRWVELQTEERIKDLFREGALNELTRVVIANAIYFKADWAKPFPVDTRPAPFTLSNGSSVEAPLMVNYSDPSVRYGAFNADGSLFPTPERVPSDGSSESSYYPDDAGFSVIEKLYRGGRISMVVIAPNDANGLAALQARLTSANLGAWIGALVEREANVHLPKFELNTRYGLKDSLVAMGMSTAFDPANADFSGITSAENVSIDAVIHQAFISVDENGTEAAAATGLLSCTASAPPATIPFVPTFRADQPFIYLIREQDSGAILFLGRVVNPTA